MKLINLYSNALALLEELSSAPKKEYPPECGFFDRRSLKHLAPVTGDMARFHRKLRDILEENEGVRKWEYGMMMHGLPYLAGKDILDIGSGPSYLPLFLSQRLQSRVTVLDLPQPFTVEATDLAQRFENAGIALILGDMRNMPFKEDRFDVVLSISVIEHLSHSADHRTFPTRKSFVKDTVTTLLEMFRVLRPGGWLYLTTDAYIPGRVDSDRWSGKLVDGEPYGAYPINRIVEIFIDPLREAGALFPYPVNFGEDLLLGNRRWSSFRHRYMTVFNIFAKKP